MYPRIKPSEIPAIIRMMTVNADCAMAEVSGNVKNRNLPMAAAMPIAISSPSE